MSRAFSLSSSESLSSSLSDSGGFLVASSCCFDDVTLLRCCFPADVTLVLRDLLVAWLVVAARPFEKESGSDSGDQAAEPTETETLIRIDGRNTSCCSADVDGLCCKDFARCLKMTRV